MQHNSTADTGSLLENQISNSFSSESADACSASKDPWASKLLVECAKAVADNDSSRIHHLLWTLNELSSPYGDRDQRLAFYFMQALLCKATGTGDARYEALVSVAEESQSFDSSSRLMLKFQEVSPWMSFGHVASNGMILEALAGETKLHVIDISNTLCTQWPTFFEALATRNDDTPHLRLTVVVVSRTIGSIMKETTQRMEKFARLMGVPFELNVIGNFNHPGELKKESLGIKDDEAVAVNCINSLKKIPADQRRGFFSVLKSLNPKVVTVVEEEADIVSSSSDDFMRRFEECLRFYATYFEMLEESFNCPTSNERLMMERGCSRSIIRTLACEERTGEGREIGKNWSERLREAFSPANFSDDVIDDVKALLKRYSPVWGLLTPVVADDGKDPSGIYLTWKEEAVVWASAWKP